MSTFRLRKRRLLDVSGLDSELPPFRRIYRARSGQLTDDSRRCFASA